MPRLLIGVSARVQKPVELIPAVLYLPHKSSGLVVYSGVSLCRSAGKRAADPSSRLQYPTD